MMTTPEKRILAARIVSKIFAELQSAAGLGDEWDQIDEDTQKQIKDACKKIVYDQIINL